MKLNEFDYADIYCMALKDFNSKTMTVANSKHLLVQCIVESFISFTKQKGVIVKEGELCGPDK